MTDLLHAKEPHFYRPSYADLPPLGDWKKSLVAVLERELFAVTAGKVQGDLGWFFGIEDDKSGKETSLAPLTNKSKPPHKPATRMEGRRK